MFKIMREMHISYGHRLLNYEGKCADLHGHNAKIQVELSSEKLDNRGMVMDFFEVRKKLGTWIDEHLDHKMILCEKDPLVDILKKAGEKIVILPENPTAEALARLIFNQSRNLRLPVSRVKVWETDRCYAEYHE